MDSNPDSLDISKLQQVLYTDPLESPSPHFDKQRDALNSSRPSTPTGLGDESFQREIDASSETSAESPNNHNQHNHDNHTQPLIPTDPIEPMDQIRTSPTVITSRTARENNTALNETGVDRTGTLQLGYTPSKQGVGSDFDPTQRDSDSYNERLRQRVEVESVDHLINFGQEDLENADTQPLLDDMDDDNDDDDDDDDDADGLRSEPRVNFFDESKRFETPPAKRRKTGSGNGDDEDDEELPLAGLPENDDMPLGLTQLFNASSPVRVPLRPPSSRNNTSPAVMFANKQGMPDYQPNNNSSPPPAPAALGLRKVVTEPTAADYVSLKESQERRNGRKNLVVPEPDKSDGLDDHEDPIQTRWERRRRERQRSKTAEEQLKNITAPARANAVRYGRKPRDKTKSSPSTKSSPVSAKTAENRFNMIKNTLANKDPIEILDDDEGEETEPEPGREAEAEARVEEEDEEEEQATEDIRPIEDPTQVDGDVVGGEEAEIQVPSTAKKAKRSPDDLRSEDTPVRAAGTDEYVSNSQEDTQSAISDSQPSLRTSQRTSQRRGRSIPKSIHDFSMHGQEEILRIVGPLTSSIVRELEKESGLPESLVPESSSPPPARGKQGAEAPPSSPPPPLRMTRRTMFETRAVEQTETEPATATTPRVLRGGKKTLSMPLSSGGQSAQSNLKTPYPEKSIPQLHPTTIPETSPALRIDDSPAALRKITRANLRRGSKDATVEIACSMSENLRPTTKIQADNDYPMTEPPKTTTTQLFQQGQKRPISLTDFSIPIPRKRFRGDALRGKKRVIQDSYDVSRYPQLPTSSENGFSSPPPSDANERQEEAATPASPPNSSPAPSAEIPVPVIDEEPSLNDGGERGRKSTTASHRKKSTKSSLRGPGKRVFAQFKGGQNYFYPATVVVDMVIAVATEIGVRFDDGTTCSLSKLKVRWLDLREDDTVKVDRQGLKQKSWLVKGFKQSGEKTELTDIRGNDIVVLQQKQTGKKAAARDNHEIEVKLTEIYLTSTQWPHFDARHVPFDAAGPATSPTRSPSSTPTATGKGQLRTPPVANYNAEVASISASAGPLTSGGLFSGMIFAVSYGGKEAEKKSVTNKIEANSGKVLRGDFMDLFTQPAKNGKYEVSLIDGVERWGFACVIADKHSRTSKYLQALALGLPCLAGRWVDECIQKRKIIPWEDYLLPAGESLHLDNAIKSRLIPPFPAKEARFVEMFQDRKKSFEGYNVIYVLATGKMAEERNKTVIFLVHALGASSVERVPSIEAACERLRKVKSTPANEKHMVVTKGKANGSKEQMHTFKSKKVMLIEDEWVIQSLIMGRLLDPNVD